MHEAFYGKYNGIFRACANSVYQASPRGEGPGNEATADLTYIMGYTCMWVPSSIRPKSCSDNKLQ